MSKKKVTISLTKNQAEALFCFLRLNFDYHRYYNNNNGLTCADPEEENDCELMDKARVAAAEQVLPQLTPEAQERHQSYSIGKSFYPAIQPVGRKL